MGLSIHYSGNIRDQKLIDPLIEEVSDIAETLNWSPKVIADKQIKGISFAPNGSEPVFLTFNSDGRLLSPINILVKDIFDDVRLDKELIFTASVKTQFAGPEAHIAIIKFLKYISAKYLVSFNLYDEGNYWETGDEKILLNQFKKYQKALDSFCEAIDGLSVAPGETAESLVEKLENILKEKFGGRKNE